MKEHLSSIGKGAIIAALGASMTYALPLLMKVSYVFEYHGAIYDFTPIVVALLSILANVLRKAAGL